MDLSYAFTLSQSQDLDEKLKGIKFILSKPNLEAFEYIKKILQFEDDFYIKTYIISNLHDFKFNETIELLMDFLNSPLADWAIISLHKLVDEKWINLHLKSFKEKESIESLYFVKILILKQDYQNLFKLLDAKSWNVRKIAAQGLINIADEKFLKKAFGNFLKFNNDQQYWLSKILFERKIPFEFEKLLNLIPKIKEKPTKQLIAKLLLFSDGFKVIEFDKDIALSLIEDIEIAYLDYNLKITLLEYCLELDNRDLKHLAGEKIVKIFLQNNEINILLKELENEKDTDKIIALLIGFVKNSILDRKLLIKYLNHKNEDIRKKLSSLLAENFPDFLFNLLKDIHIGKINVLVALANQKYKKVLPIIVKMLKQIVSKDLILALQNFKTHEVALFLTKFLNHPNFEIRQTAEKTLLSFKEMAVIAIFSEINNFSIIAKNHALNLLANMPDKTLPHALNLLSTEEKDLEKFAIDLLVKIGSYAILPLIGNFKSTNWVKRYNSFLALLKLDPAVVLEKLFFVLENEKDENIKFWAQKYIKEIIHSSFSLIKPYLDKRNIYIRTIILECLLQVKVNNIEDIIIDCLLDEFDEIILIGLKLAAKYPSKKFETKLSNLFNLHLEDEFVFYLLKALANNQIFKHADKIFSFEPTNIALLTAKYFYILSYYYYKENNNFPNEIVADIDNKLPVIIEDTDILSILFKTKILKPNKVLELLYQKSIFFLINIINKIFEEASAEIVKFMNKLPTYEAKFIHLSILNNIKNTTNYFSLLEKYLDDEKYEEITGTKKDIVAKTKKHNILINNFKQLLIQKKFLEAFDIIKSMPNNWLKYYLYLNLNLALNRQKEAKKTIEILLMRKDTPKSIKEKLKNG